MEIALLESIKYYNASLNLYKFALFCIFTTAIHDNECFLFVCKYCVFRAYAILEWFIHFFSSQNEATKTHQNFYNVGK